MDRMEPAYNRASVYETIPYSCRSGDSQKVAQKRCCSDLEELHPEIFSTSYLKRPLLAPWLRFQSCCEYGVESAPGSCAWKHAFTYCNQISRGSKHRCIHALSICMESSQKIVYAWKFMSKLIPPMPQIWSSLKKMFDFPQGATYRDQLKIRISRRIQSKIQVSF